MPPVLPCNFCHPVTEYTEYSRVLQNITEYYRVFLAHLLGPISGLVSNNPPIAKMILVSAGTEPSAPEPLVAAEGVDLAIITTTIMAFTFRG